MTKNLIVRKSSINNAMLALNVYWRELIDCEISVGKFKCIEFHDHKRFTFSSLKTLCGLIDKTCLLAQNSGWMNGNLANQWFIDTRTRPMHHSRFDGCVVVSRQCHFALMTHRHCSLYNGNHLIVCPCNIISQSLSTVLITQREKISTLNSKIWRIGPAASLTNCADESWGEGVIAESEQDTCLSNTAILKWEKKCNNYVRNKDNERSKKILKFKEKSASNDWLVTFTPMSRSLKRRSYVFLAISWC